MANVIQKVFPHVFLTSVNTPEYSEVDWIINPDLSAVEGVPQKYWTIQHVDAIDATYDIEGILLLSEAIPATDIVREMTIVEKEAYDAANPEPIDYSKMSNGEPTFIYAPTNQPISVSKAVILFSCKTNGSKNLFLDYGALSSNIAGYVATNNEIITSICATIAADVTDDITVQILKQDGTVIYTMTIPAGQSLVVAKNLTTTILENDILSCKMSSTVTFTQPCVSLILHQRF